MGAGFFSMIFALVLAPRYAHIGMAWVSVGTDFFIIAAQFIVLRSQGLDPFTYAKKMKGNTA